MLLKSLPVKPATVKGMIYPLVRTEHMKEQENKFIKDPDSISAKPDGWRQLEETAFIYAILICFSMVVLN